MGLPKLASGVDDTYFIGKGHGHEGSKGPDSADFHFSNYNLIPNSIHNSSGVWIYVPRENAPPDTGFHGTLEGPY